MMKTTTSHCLCPSCRGPVFEERRELNATDRAAFFFADVPGWILLGVCAAIGVWQWLAGVAAFAVTLFVLYLWHRERFRFRCYACDTTFHHTELLPDKREDT